MEKKNYDLQGTEELTKALNDRISKLPSLNDRAAFISSLMDCTILLYEIQWLPQRLRLEIWAATYDLINFLRQNGQLGRNELDFDADVKKFLIDVYDTMADEFILKMENT